MFANAIYQALNGLGQNGILFLAGMLLVGIFILGLATDRFRQVAPALMTSIGIFGTFCGIFLALYPVEFTDREAMDASIRALLGGMKTAFVTSLLGIGAAITFRIVSIPFAIPIEDALSRFIKIKPIQPPQEEKAVLDRLDAIKQAISGDEDSSLLTQMQKMRDENRDGHQKMDGIRESIAGDGDSSLVTQIQKSRDENRDGLGAIRESIAGNGDDILVAQIQKLRDENREGFKQLEGLSETIRTALVDNLQNLADEIRDIIGKQLGESLQQLIKSIEEALIEQFGKTFVEFNEATQALKKWQEEHRGHVEQLTRAFNLAGEKITVIAAQCERIPPTMETLQEVVGTAHDNVESLNRQVEAFAAIRQQAEEAFPVIKEHLDKIGADLASSAKGFDGLEEKISTAFQNIEQESQRAAEQHAQSMSEMSSGMRDLSSAVESETRQVAQRHAENVEKLVNDMVTTLGSAQEESAQKITGIVEGAINNFSGEMNREIERVAREWGSNLVSIAERAKDAIEAVEHRQQ